MGFYILEAIDKIRLKPDKRESKQTTRGAIGYPGMCYYQGHEIAKGYPWKCGGNILFQLGHCTAEHAEGLYQGRAGNIRPACRTRPAAGF